MVTATARRTAHALSIDVALARLLGESAGDGRVHSVFRRVINVVAPDGRLVSLCARDSDDAPWSVRVDVADWSGWGIVVDATVRLGPDGILLEGDAPCTIALPAAREWDAGSVSITADRGILEARARELSGIIRTAGVAGGALAAEGRDPFAAIVAGRIAAGLVDIVTGELDGDVDRVDRAVGALLGLGPGLTPAGDDVLTGLVLVASRPGSRTTIVRPAIAAMLDRHGRRTTDLSVATLRAALGGRARQRLVDLVDAAVGEPRELDGPGGGLRARADRVIGIGHTSGTDILSGVLAGLELEIQRRGSA